MVKSPRWLRPHKITVINVLLENTAGEEQTSTTELRHVKVEAKRKAVYGTTGRSFTDTVTVVIDANDIDADKALVDPADFNDPTSQFTLRVGDRVRFNDQELEISGVNRVNPLRSAPEFIEVSAS